MNRSNAQHSVAGDVISCYFFNGDVLRCYGIR